MKVWIVAIHSSMELRCAVFDDEEEARKYAQQIKKCMIGGENILIWEAEKV